MISSDVGSNLKFMVKQFSKKISPENVILGRYCKNYLEKKCGIIQLFLFCAEEY